MFDEVEDACSHHSSATYLPEDTRQDITATNGPRYARILHVSGLFDKKTADSFRTATLRIRLLQPRHGRLPARSSAIHAHVFSASVCK